MVLLLAPNENAFEENALSDVADAAVVTGAVDAGDEKLDEPKTDAVAAGTDAPN